VLPVKIQIELLTARENGVGSVRSFWRL